MEEDTTYYLQGEDNLPAANKRICRLCLLIDNRDGILFYYLWFTACIHKFVHGYMILCVLTILHTTSAEEHTVQLTFCPHLIHCTHTDEYLEVDSDDDFVYEEVSYPNLITPLHTVTFSLHILRSPISRLQWMIH